MSAAFDRSEGLIVVPVELTGPSATGVARLALDTGATDTLINVAMLVSVAYDPSLVSERVQVTTGSGVEFAARILLQRIVAIGRERTRFPVLGHTLPSSTGIDGLLGLDFLRGQVLTIDFRAGSVSLDS
jgi:predicted aspartyl protease